MEPLPVANDWIQAETILDMCVLFIGMPVHNGERYITKALDSLINQTFTDWKLVISDNDSSDRTPLICRDYASADKRIQYIRQDVNIGAVNNFLFLLEMADCPYFMWAAADDLWDKYFVEANIKGLSSSLQAGWAFSNMVNIDSYGTVIREYPSFFRFVHSDQYLNIASFILDPEYLGKANLIYGIYKLSGLKNFMVRFLTSPEARYPAADVAFNLGILCRTRLYINEQVLFMKRYARPTDSPVRSEWITAVAPYVNGVIGQKEFALYKKAIAAACHGTQFEDFVNFLMDYRERLNNDIGHVVEKSRSELLNSRRYKVGTVILTPLSILRHSLAVLKSKLDNEEML